MNKIKSGLNKLVHYSWINSMFSCRSVVKSSDSLTEIHSSSSYVSCARVSLSDLEMGWVDVDEHSSASHQFGRTLSSSSSSFRLSISMDEMDMDYVVVNTSVPLLTPSSTFPPSPLNYNTNASRSFASPSSFPPRSSSPAPSLSSNMTTTSSSSSSSSAASAASSPPPQSSNSFSSSNHSVSSRTSVSLSTSLSSSSSNQPSDDSTSTRMLPSLSDLSVTTSTSVSSSNHHSEYSTSTRMVPSISDVSVSTSTRTHKSRSRTIFIMHSSFKWQEILLAVSFTVPVGLLSTTFKAVDGILVPDVIFTSNPRLFYIFIILDALAFTASIIGILIHALKKKKYLYCLSIIAFTALIFAFAIYLWVFLPNFLRFIPFVMLIAILLVLLYVSGESLYKRAASKKLPQRRIQQVATVTSS